MAYDRYDPERRWRERDERDPRSWDRDDRDFGRADERGSFGRERGFFGRDERDSGRGERFFGRDEGDFRGRDERDRGFFERAGDQFRSWFGDDDRDRPRSSGRDYGDRELRERERGFDRERERGYRPMAGDYARSGSEERNEGRDLGSGSQWDRDPYRRTSFAGSRATSNQDDLHYEEWRRRQMEGLDRDYDDYRRECADRFENDFGTWRDHRQSKRQILREVREHMEVLGSDNEHVGTVDRVAGDRIILSRSDPQSGGVHHSLSCTDIDRIEDNRVILDCSASKARERWRDESRSRALFEREDQGSAGPHILDRSFSGTYR